MTRGFPLAGLKRLRDLTEAGAAGRLAVANADLARSRSQSASIRQDATAAGEDLATGADLLAIAASRASNRGLLLELHAHQAHLQREVDRAEQEHRQARREAAMVEKLELRHTAAAARTELAAEQSRLDEAAQRSHQGGRST